jgi:hypothetical protein
VDGSEWHERTLDWMGGTVNVIALDGAWSDEGIATKKGSFA